MNKFVISKTNRLILFPYHVVGKSVVLIPERIMTDQYPLTWVYLNENKSYLDKRENERFKGTEWYCFGRSQALNVISEPKLITPDLSASASFCYDKYGCYYFTGGAAGGYGLIIDETYDDRYILGLLNSKLLDSYLQKISTRFRGGYFSYESRFIRQLPIRTIDLNSPTEKAQHDKMVSLVERMLDLNKKLQNVKIAHERELLERQIKITDNQIDQLVYELYGLTEEEIRVVEISSDLNPPPEVVGLDQN